MESSKQSLKRELLLYLVFGVLTTVVSMVSNFGILWGARLFADLSDTTSAAYVTAFSIAKTGSWVAAVLFAFFTNKKWVFQDTVSDASGVLRQLLVFAGGRLATLGLDFAVNYLCLLGLTALSLTFLDGFFGFSLQSINELAAWGVTQVLVVVTNYFLSKWLVFRKKSQD
jgi:putative flippase GtrA